MLPKPPLSIRKPNVPCCILQAGLAGKSLPKIIYTYIERWPESPLSIRETAVPGTLSCIFPHVLVGKSSHRLTLINVEILLCCLFSQDSQLIYSSLESRNLILWSLGISFSVIWKLAAVCSLGISSLS